MNIRKCLLAVAAAVMAAAPLGGKAQGLRTEVQRDDYSRLQVAFSVDGVRAGTTDVCGTTFGTLGIGGCESAAPAGKPSVPVAAWLIEVPLCEGFDVTVTDAVYDTLDASALGLTLQLAPAQPDRSKSDTTRPQLTMDSAVYHTDAYYSLPMAQVEAVGVARDRRLARLTLSPTAYNPVSRKVVVCRSATVCISYRDADEHGTRQLFERHHTPAFGIGTQCLNGLYHKAVSTATPVRYTIVANSMFRGALDEFVEWKQRKGFVVDVAYTDEPQVGNTTTSIAAYLKAQYTGANDSMPAPTYVLLVGDVAQIPAFTGQTDAEHVTDLYYATWSGGDHVPDCYYGRFSASSLSQLTPQIEKTLMYEQYAFGDPSFLDRAVMVAGVDGGNAGDYGYTHGDPTMDYAITNYVNQNNHFTDVRYFKNNTSIVPNAQGVTMGSSAGQNAAAVRATYDLGASLINYTAHGGSDCWGTPYFSVDHVAQMTNHERFGLMIGNCCLSNKFDNSVCLGEALLRRDDYCGAVGYIGASNSSYWGSDVYWSVGVRYTISVTMSMNYMANNLGAYDRMFHTHNELHEKWAETQGSIVMAGNMAVQSGNGGSVAHYYWEIYHLMGDPSVMPYLTQAGDMPLTADQVVAAGSTTLHVAAVPFAYVALTHDGEVVAAAFAGTVGEVDLVVPGGLEAGSYELTASAQQYKTMFMTVTAVPTEGACLAVNAIETDGELEAGASCRSTLTLSNLGNGTASDVVLHLSSDNPHLGFAHDDIVVGTVAAQSSVALGGLRMIVAGDAANGESATVTVSVASAGGEQYATRFGYTLKAVDVAVKYASDSCAIPRGGTGHVTVRLTNKGFATLRAADLQLVPQTALVNVSPTGGGAVTLAYGQSVERTFTIHLDSRLAEGASAVLTARLVNPSHDVHIGESLALIVGRREVETFAGNAFHTAGWSQGAHPWEIVSDSSDLGNLCLRSARTLTHNQTSTIELSCNVTQPDSIAFRCMVSSEAGYDKLRFYIDGEEIFSDSGEKDWYRMVYAVEPGQHTFKFSYEKDYSVSSHWDCALLDDVELPFTARNITYRTDHVCIGDAYAPFGNSVATQTASSGVVVSADSLTVVDYEVRGSETYADTVVACDRYTVGSSVYTESADMVLLLQDQYGCDSTVALHLTVGHSTTDTMVVNGADEYVWNGDTYTEEGTYVRYMYSEEGCDSVLVLLLNTGVEGITTPGYVRIGMYPNPTTATVLFDTTVDRVDVYDLAGRKMTEGERTDRVDLTALPAGVYVMKMTIGGQTATSRVVRR